MLLQGVNEMTFVPLRNTQVTESALNQRNLLRIILQQDSIVQKGLTELDKKQFKGHNNQI